VSRRGNRAERLRTAVELLPRHTREAMLRGIEDNSIIVGGYTDGEGGVCPMLAAHRNGGRTSHASFARAWDTFTGAGRRPRRASRRELRILRTYLEMSLLDEDTGRGADASISSLADRLRAERRELAGRQQARPGDPDRATELRSSSRWSWLRPARRYDVFEATISAASEQLAEQDADEQLDERRHTHA
jgi:hypothetical protein